MVDPATKLRISIRFFFPCVERARPVAELTETARRGSNWIDVSGRLN
jgi:hypothetical protein